MKISQAQITNLSNGLYTDIKSQPDVRMISIEVIVFNFLKCLKI
jgi:hypothetical protein